MNRKDRDNRITELLNLPKRSPAQKKELREHLRIVKRRAKKDQPVKKVGRKAKPDIAAAEELRERFAKKGMSHLLEKHVSIRFDLARVEKILEDWHKENPDELPKTDTPAGKARQKLLKWLDRNSGSGGQQVKK